MQRKPLLLLALAAALGACTTLPVARERPVDTQPTSESIQATQLRGLLGELARVVGGSPAEQAEVMADARHDFEQARLGSAALRYGLLLAAPVHPGRDPVEAQQVLRESLAHPELLSAMERTLGHVELERINAELRLGDENQRLLVESQQARERQRSEPSSAALTRQLQAAQEQNAQLRKALDDARAKLDAIAEFERRQTERPPASEVRNP